MTNECKHEEKLNDMGENLRRLNKFAFIGNGSPPATVIMTELRKGQEELSGRYDRQEKWVRAIVLLIIAQILAFGFSIFTANSPSDKTQHHYAGVCYERAD